MCVVVVNLFATCEYLLLLTSFDEWKSRAHFIYFHVFWTKKITKKRFFCSCSFCIVQYCLFWTRYYTCDHHYVSSYIEAPVRVVRDEKYIKGRIFLKIRGFTGIHPLFIKKFKRLYSEKTNSSLISGPRGDHLKLCLYMRQQHEGNSL